MHMAIFLAPAPASPLTSWAIDDSGAAIKAMHSSSVFFMDDEATRSEERWGSEHAPHRGWFAPQTADDYRGAYILTRSPLAAAHEIHRFRQLRRHTRLDAGGERGDHAEAPAAGEGRTRHRQDDAGRRSGQCDRHAAAAVAH